VPGMRPGLAIPRRGGGAMGLGVAGLSGRLGLIIDGEGDEPNLLVWSNRSEDGGRARWDAPGLSRVVGRGCG
jgi:hypothetical protein